MINANNTQAAEQAIEGSFRGEYGSGGRFRFTPDGDGYRGTLEIELDDGTEYTLTLWGLANTDEDDVYTVDYGEFDGDAWITGSLTTGRWDHRSCDYVELDDRAGMLQLIVNELARRERYGYFD